MHPARRTLGGEIWLSRPIDGDRLLLWRVAAGDEKALTEIYDRFGRSLFGYVLTISQDRELAEEILQDTLVAVWRDAGSYAGRSSAKTWVFGVCRRQAHNALRRRNLPLAGGEASDALPAPDPGPEEILLVEAWQRELADRIGSLAPLHRETLILFFFQGLSYEETAEVAGVPVGTIKSRLSNAKKALRKLLQKERER